MSHYFRIYCIVMSIDSAIFITGEMMIHCDRLRNHVISSLGGCSTHLHTPLSPANPFGSYDYLSMRSPAERNKLMELLSQVENSKCYQVHRTVSGIY